MTDNDRYLPWAEKAPGGSERAPYLEAVVLGAARSLRAGHNPDLVACDLEDALAWHVDPKKCAHPKWRWVDGHEQCRYCHADVRHIDPMGG